MWLLPGSGARLAGVQVLAPGVRRSGAVALDDQHAARRVRHDVAGHAPDQQLRDPGATVRTYHDQVGAFAARGLDQDLARVAALGAGRDLETGALELALAA